ncbi:ImmA/IrrE family metallo-endopeptidase [Marinomonas mediterranea]|uniref:HTH cro/C1-type domain-containing protein n=2 Tax=Marinomonas mediterranea TaxID=119864 RepID=F2K1D8_MARM1|nr:XRE family transcriptional regulator [Marinomonas mediterranea]ADZ91069.1 protein of unknown function DUF955 [Marinomonas mediterranea MMB-1]WCN15469.1 ImmA/IrrE family metallo-endopeptidase [Marinomonas mediterranea]WCN19541.1 ImmA/IrrE family metallo-endopeptidase [Marinomonas mediterranea MMB-1]
MSKALINPANIIWARVRAGMSVSQLADALGVKEEKVIAWENGENAPSMAQARNIADKTLISFGLLFAKQPPADDLPIPDLRTIDGRELQKPSASLIAIIRKVLERQEWYKEYRKDNLKLENSFITQFTMDSDTSSVVADMRNRLSLPAKRSGRWDDYERVVRQHIEKLGIMVMRERDLGGKSKPLLVQEFRGFAICDDVAPVIFINSADAQTAQLFTMLHELAHIWIGQSGLSDVSPSNHRKEEAKCNAIAAEFLVPEDEFLQVWIEKDWRLHVSAIAKHFHVSRWVIVRRALTLGLITEAQYYSMIESYKKDHERNSNGGPSYYTTKISRLGKSFASAVVSEALSGRMLLRDAGHLLGTKPLNVKNLAKELGI